ncbi:MAG: carboxypeptidase M32 [Alphaproteobacteria bacterium]
MNAAATPPVSAYAELERRFARRSAILDAAGMLEWDYAAMMPEGGAGARGRQLVALQRVAHDMLTDPAVGDLLDAAEGDAGLDGWQADNLRRMRRIHAGETAVPADLVEAFTQACKDCEMVWRKARPASDFAALLPALQRVLDLVRQVAAAKAERFGCAPYDALLDDYDPGATTARIDAVFEPYAAALPDLLDDALRRQAARPQPVRPEGPFPVESQRALGHALMRAVGFDFDHGRLDVSLHPFCGGVPDDVRITTRYDEADFASGLMGVLHETGHAMYERGLPADWRGQPVGHSCSMALHESQSLLVEMQACRSPAFLRFAAGRIRAAFGERPGLDADNLARLYTRVKPDFIRVDADEITYPAHVILRYRLEKALMAGALPLADVPGEWNRGLQALIGVTPPDDRRGCLQDIHWPDGLFGYFPTYTLGAMAAAQLFDAAVRADPAIPDAIGRGDFAPLMAWLRTHVHGHGSRYATDTILQRATGRPLDPSVFMAHLRRRYLDG